MCLIQMKHAQMKFPLFSFWTVRRGGGGSIVRMKPDTALYSINVSTLCCGHSFSPDLSRLSKLSLCILAAWPVRQLKSGLTLWPMFISNVKTVKEQTFHKRTRNVPRSKRNETKTFEFVPEFVSSKEIISIWSRRVGSGPNQNNLVSLRQKLERYQNVLI